MNLFLILWLADICDNVGTAFVLSMFIGVIIVLVTAMLTDENLGEPIEETQRKAFTKYFKIYVLLILILGIIAFILPSSKTIYIATGINAITETTKTVAESDTAKKAVELLNIKLDEYLKEAKTDK
jgi:quinol-cytochrome oxidoreductase complex cytochrome b subunit